MDSQEKLVQHAKALPREQRQSILLAFQETKLHKHLKSLLENMEPNYTTAITHGPNELGKDLVIVKKDNIGIDVTAIVVKCGNIRGTTAGEVDQVTGKVKEILKAGQITKLQEIESQVNQALEHPAEIATIFRGLPVNKVIVIVAGTFSQTARKRLVAEVSVNLEDIRDIDWLIDKFTDHYPQIFFEQEVIDFLQDQITRLEVKHWLGGKRINFSDYYIEPLVAKTMGPQKLDARSLDALAKRERLPFSKLKEIIDRNRRILLVGDASSGKSGALVRLAIQMLRDASANVLNGDGKKKPIEMPILVTARQLLDTKSIDSLLETIALTTELKGRMVVKTLMVDALDEVPSASRQEALEKAIRFAEELKTNLLLTSRKVEILKNIPKGFSEYELLPFQVSQALRLFEKLVGGNKDKLKVLKSGLEKIQFKIPMVPLSLLFLLELVEEKKEIPASVTELYDRFSDIALGRWDKEKGIEVLFEYLIKKRFLASLAHIELHCKGRVEMPRSEFDQFLDSYAQEYDWDAEYQISFIKELERTGILQMTETVMFKHRSFLDYFGAFYIYDQHDKIDNVQDLIVRIYFDDNWGDAAFFAIGLRREVSEAILEKIFDFSRDDIGSHLAKFGVGRLLQAGWHSKAKTRRAALGRGLAYGPILRKDFTNAADQQGNQMPGMLADVIVLGIAETSYASSFLLSDQLELLKKYHKEPSPDNIFSILSILFSLKDLMSKSEIKVAVREYTDLLEKHGSIADKVKAFPFLMFLQKDDDAAVKKLRKRAIELLRKHPEVVSLVRGKEKMPRTISR